MLQERVAASSTVPVDWGVGPNQMRSGHLRGILRFVRTRGGDPASLLERCNIPSLALNDPELLVDCNAVVDMLEDSATNLNDSLFGARFGATQSVDVFGTVAALGRATQTVGEGLSSFIKYLPLMHSSEGWLELVRSDRHAEHRWTGSGRFASNLQGNLQAAVLQMKILRMLGGKEFRPSYVTLVADIESARIEELERLLECRVLPNGQHNAVGFDARVLDWPVPTSNRMIHALIESHLRAIGSQRKPALTERVSAFISNALPSGSCTLSACADILGTSPRTLQLKLEAEGESFTEMVEERRAAIARQLLETDDMSLIEIAGRLGYAEQSSFSRAFRRWYGSSPQQMRKQMVSA